MAGSKTPIEMREASLARCVGLHDGRFSSYPRQQDDADTELRRVVLPLLEHSFYNYAWQDPRPR